MAALLPASKMKPLLCHRFYDFTPPFSILTDRGANRMMDKNQYHLSQLSELR